MAQPVRQLAIRAPGFQGLNTELSPINGDPEFALVADNVVVDQIGRLASRKAFAEYRSASGIVLELVGEQNMKGFRATPNTFIKERGMYDENGDPYIAELFIIDNADPASPSESPRGKRFWTQGPPPEWNLADGIQSLDVYDPSFATETSTWVLSLELRISLNETTKNMVIGTFVAIQNGNEIARLDALSDAETTSWERSFRVPVADIASPITFQFQPNPDFYAKTGNGTFYGFLRRVSLGITESVISTGFEEIIKLGKYIYEYRNVQKKQNQRPLMIKRYGTSINTMFDKRTIPLGSRRRNAQKKGVVELEGEITYGVSVLIGTDMVDTPLPSGWGGEGNVSLSTAEFCNLKDSSFLFARGQPFLILDDRIAWEEVGGGVVKVNPNDFQDPVADSVQKIDGDIAISAYGRLWVTGVNNDYHTIYYSSLLDETSWYDERVPPADEAEAATYVPPYNVQNTGGLIDVREYWPVESDVIVNIHAHNGYLFVFGRNSILIYAGADAPDPAGEDGIRLEDAISDVGLIRRDAICNIGTDIMFVDDSGVRSLGRVIQEKSNPLQEPSINIRREIQDVIAQELIEVPSHSAVKMEYLPSESIAVLLFASLRVAYVFDLAAPSKTGGLKVTRWTECSWNDAIELKDLEEDIVYLGGKPQKGLMKYDGYLQLDAFGDVEPYVMRYESMALALGQSPMQTAIPKSINYVCMGEYVPGQANALWGFADRFVGSREFQIDVVGGAEYNVNEFTDDGSEEMAGYYPDGGPYYKGYKINTTGSGELFRVGFEVKVQGGRYALQEIDINSAIGRLTA